MENEDLMPDTVTIDIADSNDIRIPMEWSVKLNFISKYVQITLADDRIVIHKPTAVGVEYDAPCKVSDDSFIRSFGLLGVRIPKQLLKRLDIESDGKADLFLEENCVSIRKNTAVALEIPVPEPPEPLMAFCCVCGNLLYTGDGLTKVLSKHICCECVELVKSL